MVSTGQKHCQATSKSLYLNMSRAIYVCIPTVNPFGGVCCLFPCTDCAKQIPGKHRIGTRNLLLGLLPASGNPQKSQGSKS